MWPVSPTPAQCPSDHRHNPWVGAPNATTQQTLGTSPLCSPTSSPRCRRSLRGRQNGTCLSLPLSHAFPPQEGFSMTRLPLWRECGITSVVATTSPRHAGSSRGRELDLWRGWSNSVWIWVFGCSVLTWLPFPLLVLGFFSAVDVRWARCGSRSDWILR
jgi:hypothetical protein